MVKTGYDRNELVMLQAQPCIILAESAVCNFKQNFQQENC